ncbi:MAG: leucine-rich repeat domain-containing protein [Bacillota bacterium]|nr:leucine-rich repeat domain-containing protein [Bacillota bacterium]
MMRKRILSSLLTIAVSVALLNGGITFKVYAASDNITPKPVNTSPSPNPSPSPSSSPTPVSDPVQAAFPISIYDGETDVTFTPGNWGSITASISQEGVGGSNCIKYSNLINNPYSPGPQIIFSTAKDIRSMKDSDRLHLVMDIGTVPISQPVRIIFNGDPSLSVVTPNLNKTSVFEVLNLDISSIRAKLGGKITKMSFEGAGGNGWQGVSNLFVNEISIIRPANGDSVPIIAPVPPTQPAANSLPIYIYHDESNVYFNPAYWGSITGEITSEGVGGTNCIKYSNLMNNVYAPSPEAVFANPINISNMADSDRLQLSMSLGDTSPPQAIKIIFNGDSALNIITPKVDTSLGFQTLNLDISSIKAGLGGQITQMSFESAGPNGWNNVDTLFVDEISVVSGILNDEINAQSNGTVKTQVKNAAVTINDTKTGTVTNNSVVTFKSKALETAVRNVLGKSTGILYKNDVEKITQLNVENKDITDLSGIENLTNLQTIDFAKNQISDISPLKNLKNLKDINLSYNKISDISALSGLISLQSINLSFNKISNITALKGLTKLQSLDLNNYYHVNNYISDISALKDLTNLQYLYLSNTKAGDISAFKNLINLKSLFLDNYAFCDISVLKNLTNLQTLYLDDNQIKDISALKGLVNLQYLYLSNTQLTDISALKGLTNLQQLYLSNTKISDISNLTGLTKLQTLYIDNNNIKDISVLASLTKLQTLNLDSNKVKDISALRGLVNLQFLYLSNNQISEISALKDLTKLQTLYLNQNQIKDITALKGLVKLQTLYLNQNQLKDLSILKGLTGVQYLYLSGNQVSDITPLKVLTSLNTLDLRSNQISAANKTLLAKAITKCKIFF